MLRELGSVSLDCASNALESEGTEAWDDIRNQYDNLPGSDDGSMNELRVDAEGGGCNRREDSRDEVCGADNFGNGQIRDDDSSFDR